MRSSVCIMPPVQSNKTSSPCCPPGNVQNSEIKQLSASVWSTVGIVKSLTIWEQLSCEYHKQKHHSSHLLVNEVVQFLCQTLPGELEQRNTQDLMKAQQSIPHTKHHGTRWTGQGHGRLVLRRWNGQPSTTGEKTQYPSILINLYFEKHLQ